MGAERPVLLALGCKGCRLCTFPAACGQQPDMPQLQLCGHMFLNPQRCKPRCAWQADQSPQCYATLPSSCKYGTAGRPLSCAVYYV